MKILSILSGLYEYGDSKNMLCVGMVRTSDQMRRLITFDPDDNKLCIYFRCAYIRKATW